MAYDDSVQLGYDIIFSSVPMTMYSSHLRSHRLNPQCLNHTTRDMGHDSNLIYADGDEE